MPTITLPHGEVHYRDAGPVESPSGPPVVFVHGLLVDSQLWSGVASLLATAGVRSFAPDLPLGSHTVPVGAEADQSPRGVARQVISFLQALDLTDVTLVGNDTGGAICQYLLDTDPSRVGRVVLTNCDAFELFPPPEAQAVIETLRQPASLAEVAEAMRDTKFRHGKYGYGPFARDYDAAMTFAWTEPARANPGVREDVARFAAAMDAADLVDVATRLRTFTGPVHLVWGTADPFFPLEYARRLAAAFKDATLVEVEGAYTFVPLDAPDRVAAAILELTPAALPPAGG